jgi:PAS domain-containing protein
MANLSRFYHADGTPMALEDCPTEIALTQGRAVWGCEAIHERTDGSHNPIIPYRKPLRDGNGTIVGGINMTVDISERKKAEFALAERNAQLALAGKVVLVGSYAYDVNADEMRVSEGYAAIHGLPEGTAETTRSAWRMRVHPGDVERVERLRSRPPSTLVLEWLEVGGPRVDAPGKSTYGTSTIHHLIPYEFGGTVDLVFAPEG